jgi:small-conductance mechanosensitive channel
MGIIDRFEEEYLDVSSSRATVRELLELFVGAVLFVVGASALAYYLLGQRIAVWLAAALTVVFTIMLVSQAYWAVTGREDYEE